jgi:hypothetical protein
MLGGSRDVYRSRRRETTPKSDTKRGDQVKKKVRWLLKNGYTFIGMKTIAGKDYLCARKGKTFKSAGPYSVAEPYLRSLTSREKPEPEAPRGADEMAAAVRREFDQLEADVIANPARLNDYISKLVPLRNPDLWRRFSLLAGSDGPKVLNFDFVGLSFNEKVRTAVANGAQTPDYHSHVVEKMNEWIQGAIQAKRGSQAPQGVVSVNCNSCNGRMEAFSDWKTRVCVWCDTCLKHPTWSCVICGETMLCLNGDEQGIHLRCPKCLWGCSFAEPIKLNSPQTDEGWRLLDTITAWSPRAVEHNPKRIMTLVSFFEKNQDLISKRPEMLLECLRGVGVSALDAGAIAKIQLKLFTLPS